MPSYECDRKEEIISGMSNGLPVLTAGLGSSLRGAITGLSPHRPVPDRQPGALHLPCSHRQQYCGHLLFLQRGLVAFLSPLLRCLPGGDQPDPGPCGTAAMIVNGHLVITTNTAIAHLAGAMAQPAWLLLYKVLDWKAKPTSGPQPRHWSRSSATWEAARYREGTNW